MGVDRDSVGLWEQPVLDLCTVEMAEMAAHPQFAAGVGKVELRVFSTAPSDSSRNPKLGETFLGVNL